MYPNVGTAGTSTHLIQVEISGQSSLGNDDEKKLYYKTEVFDKFLAEGEGGKSLVQNEAREYTCNVNF